MSDHRNIKKQRKIWRTSERAAHPSHLLKTLPLSFSKWNASTAAREVLKAREQCRSCCVFTASFVKREIIQVEVSEEPRESDRCMYETWLQEKREWKKIQALVLEL